jgi:hypothetical protein
MNSEKKEKEKTNDAKSHAVLILLNLPMTVVLFS